MLIFQGAREDSRAYTCINIVIDGSVNFLSYNVTTLTGRTKLLINYILISSLIHSNLDVGDSCKIGL